ncbi:BadF/BadG/BcrA/BcrD ATPase family protein [Thermogemmatispora sp.]|uniref:BadF/BadG/BcrA/BcrD ATPase family protein n=1 Tax=Thermogemmatispora sp. TaxID=1968838 RepID=UPI001DADA25F|nr:BadF/BadG/BcrA/BcrD ATPase family protein [Thermogemmatispora sp.]MBX5450466.1 BadF/BadG/BcrA/BcrD type ATPase [Thermogemmatispora sp.]
MMSNTSQKHGATRDEEFYLGVDGGGSKTLAIVVDRHGRERGRALAGRANYVSVGQEEAIRQVRQAAERALQAAGATSRPRAAWIGLAGLDRPADHAVLSPPLASLAEQVYVTNDAELPLAALEQAIGVVLIAGTGSIALGRDACGRVCRAGGWGYLLGDEGSGYDIGRQALQAAARAADGRGPHTSLLPRILAYWGLERAEDLLGVVYHGQETAAIAQLATCVFAAAREGDPVARRIVGNAAAELALAALVVSHQLEFPENVVPLALAGSLLVREAPFRAQILRRLRARRRLGQVVIVEEPALSAAKAAIHLEAIRYPHGAPLSTAGSYPSNEGRGRG